MTWKTLAALAWRNLWRNRRRTVITASTIAIGFALAVFSIGLGDGGHNQMIRTAIRMGEGHLTVQAPGYLEAPANHIYIRDGTAVAGALERTGVPGQVAPRVELQVLVSSANNAVGGMLQGLDLGRDPQALSLRPRLTEGRWPAPGDATGVVIGRKMAQRLKARLGTRLVVMAGVGTETESQLARVRGIFASGIDELDAFVLLSDLDYARRLLGAPAAESAVTRFAIFLDDDRAVARWKRALVAAALPDGARAYDWQEIMPQLVNFIALDDAGGYVWLLFLLVMVAFGILNTILMSVLERTREFGLLRALGMSPPRLLALVFIETVMLALVSVGAGWVVGGAVHLYFATYGLDLSSISPEALKTAGVMLDPVMKSELSARRIAVLTLIVLGTTVLAGVYPAIRAARVSPLRALQT